MRATFIIPTLLFPSSSPNHPNSSFVCPSLEHSRWRPILPSPPCWSPAPSPFRPRWTDHSGYLPTPRSRAAVGGPAASSTRNLPNPWNISVTRLPCPISMLTGSMLRVSRACMDLSWSPKVVPTEPVRTRWTGISPRDDEMTTYVTELG